MRALSRSILAAAALATLAGPPATAQIVVVPLEPAPGTEGDLAGTGLIPTEPVTGFEPLPADPGTNWVPELDPLDPTTVEPWQTLPENDPWAVPPLPPGSMVGEDVTTVEEDTVGSGTGAVLKGLDKLAGTVEQIELADGQTAKLGWLEIRLGQCRYPEDYPAGEAYAWLEIAEEGHEEPAFRGWMIASSPALNALDHARFDVWVVRCLLPETAQVTAAGDGAESN